MQAVSNYRGKKGNTQRRQAPGGRCVGRIEGGGLQADRGDFDNVAPIWSSW